MRCTASVPSCINFRVKALEFSACVVGGEVPVDPGLLLVSLVIPGGDPLLDAGYVGQAVVESLAGEHAEFRLGDVQPAFHVWA